MKSKTKDTQSAAAVTTNPKESLSAGVRSVLEAGGWTDPEQKAAAYADALDVLGAPLPRFLDELPLEHPRAEAHAFFSTDLWVDRVGAEVVVDALRAFCHSAGAGVIFGDGLPTWNLRGSRLGFSSPAQRTGKAVGAGMVRYECALTDKAFLIAAGAPVPCLFADAYEGETRRDEIVYTVHPALMEAGAAFVLWAAWTRVERSVRGEGEPRRAGYVLGDAVELLTLLLITEPEDVGTERPGRPYEGWDETPEGKVERCRMGWEPAA